MSGSQGRLKSTASRAWFGVSISIATALHPFPQLLELVKGIFRVISLEKSTLVSKPSAAVDRVRPVGDLVGDDEEFGHGVLLGIYYIFPKKCQIPSFFGKNGNSKLRSSVLTMMMLRREVHPSFPIIVEISCRASSIVAWVATNGPAGTAEVDGKIANRSGFIMSNSLPSSVLMPSLYPAWICVAREKVTKLDIISGDWR